MNRTGVIVPKWRPAPAVHKGDRRVRRTAHALTQALVTLALRKRYDAITVQDLLEQANVGRSTFYSHYRGKDDLLLRSFEQMLEMLDGRLGPADPRVAPVRELFEHVGASQGFYHALGRARILDRQFQVGVDRLSVTIGRRLAARGQNGGPVPPEVAARALAGALCALLRWWVDTRSSISAARMDQLYHSLHFAPHA